VVELQHVQLLRDVQLQLQQHDELQLQQLRLTSGYLNPRSGQPATPTNERRKSMALKALGDELLRLEAETFEIVDLVDLDSSMNADATSTTSCACSTTSCCSCSTSSCCGCTSCSTSSTSSCA
jgi:thiazolylpeptide-type bacteriocin precursor